MAPLIERISDIVRDERSVRIRSYVAAFGRVGFVADVVLIVMTLFLESWQPGFAVSVLDPVWLVVGGLLCIAAASCENERGS